MGSRWRRGRPYRAGESALAEWRALRWRVLRQEWRSWSLILGFWVAALVGVFVASGSSRLVAAGLVGAMTTLLLFGWALGGDVHSLTWLWGRIGEQQTEAVLARLPSEWRVEHDIRHPYGNWDHVVVGTAGLFLLDSKRFRGPSFAADDALRAGRSRFNGGTFRHNAVKFGEALAPLLGRRAWVQSVVVVWDEFPQGRYEDDRVIYVAGGELVGWLSEQPIKLTSAQRDQHAAAVRELRTQLASKLTQAGRASFSPL
jgi:hypothetical protein